MATEITKTLDGVGAFEIQEGSRLETLVPDSVATVAQTGEKGAENNHVDVDDEKGAVVETAIETAVAGPCESKIEKEEEGVTSLAVVAETNNDLDVDMEMGEVGNGDEKLDIDLNGEEGEQENKDVNEEEGEQENKVVNGEEGEQENKDVNGEEGEHENKDEVQSDGEQKEEYQIGDFVWGKIRSHPWWPGQIYDSSDASEYAKKKKSSGHLVAYFGDGSFSWCSRTQLRHMKGDDFNKKSRQSNSTDFSTAVDNALGEISRLVKLKMTCSCIPTEADRQFVENGGIKQGVLVPDHGITLLSTIGFESNKLLATIKAIAKTSSAKNRLEVATITGWLSAFNRKTKGTHELAVFDEPCYIDGLEDKKKKDEKKLVVSRLHIPDEIMSDEEALSLKKKQDDNTIDPLHQRKKKSVADLLKESKTVEADNSQTPKTKMLKSAKRSKKGNESSRKMTKKKMNENEDDKDDKEKADDENVEIVHTPRERKRSKYLSPPYTNPNVFFSKRDFKLDSIEMAKLSSLNEPVTNSSESVARTNSPGTSDSFLMEANDTAKDVLSVLKITALDPLDLRRKNPLGISKGILLSFREAYYLNGSTYNEYHQNQRGRKKRNLDNSGASHGKKKLKRCGSEKETPTLLMVTFPPGFSLPSKDKIIGMFSKFGLINEGMTDVSYNSYCARIAFVNSSDAEEAFNTCSKENPFGDAAAGKIKYRLGSVTEVEPEKPKGENGDKSRFVFIKKKLEKMASMLEKCDGSVSGERKKKLEDEMKGLVQKVSEMMAES